jgi:hypothetical protein
MQRYVERSLLPLMLLVLTIGPASTLERAQPGGGASNGATSQGETTARLQDVTDTVIDPAFDELCKDVKNSGFYLCKADRSTLPGRLKVFALMEACKTSRAAGYCNWATELSRLTAVESPTDAQRIAIKAALAHASGTLLQYSHRDDNWREVSFSENTEEDANGIPTVFRSHKLDLAVVITDTNPLLYEVRAGEVKEADIPLVADLKAFASLLGTGLAGAVTTITSRLAIAVPQPKPTDSSAKESGKK